MTAARLILVGVDTGGTFTDIVAYRDGQLLTHKVPSTPDDPARAVIEGLAELLPDTSPSITTYGTTVATNALLERRGARVALITTAGFEDVIEIGRQNRPALYALEPRPIAPLVARRDRLGVAERTRHDGTIALRLQPRELQRLVARLKKRRPEAVAICLLHSYANGAHERRIATALRRALSLPISVSHQLVPEYREFERSSTTVINAYVAPVMSRHLARLEKGLSATTLRVMQSNGGAISTRVAADEPVRTVLSGPAGGVMGACRAARDLGIDRMVTFDMGGTSTDVALIDGSPELRTEWQIGGLPIQVPAIDIHTVGAGGGSIARVDAAQAVKVGPESAGADPGPACYGRGTQATVTDANLMMGRLVADRFLAGRMRLSRERAEAALSSIGKALGISAITAADGITRIANASMERALRTISIERGHDPRTLSLVAFGGAAGQHACDLARALGMRRVIVPANPGLLSAWGCATADWQRDYAQAVLVTNPRHTELDAFAARLATQARRDLDQAGVPARRRRLHASVDVRYAGQSHSLPVILGTRLADRFHELHERLYGYCDRRRAIEVTSVRLTAVGSAAKQVPRRRMQTAVATRTTHAAWLGGRWRPVPVIDRDGLRPGETIRGPALLVELSATTFVAAGWLARAHEGGHVEIVDGD